MDSEHYSLEQQNRDNGSYYETGPQKKSRLSGDRSLVIILSVLFALLLFSSAFVQKNNIYIDAGSNGLSVRIVGKRASVQDSAELISRQKTSQETVKADMSSESSDDSVGSGVVLKICEDTFSDDSSGMLLSGNGSEESPENETMDLAEIYEKVLPSVVTVCAKTDLNEEVGTGIVMSEDGYIITNHRLVKDAAEISVFLSDCTECEAKLVGSDSVSDLAVIRIRRDCLTAAEFADSDKLLPGDPVICISNPMGAELCGTMTDGIISAVNRDIDAGGRTITVFQTNAPIGGGKAGGPLIDRKGHVVAINTTDTEALSADLVDGLGLAISVNSAKPIVDQIIAYGHVPGNPAIGVYVSAIPEYVLRYYDYPDGVYVDKVCETSDAYAKGLEKGDIITEVNGISLTAPKDLQQAIKSLQIGDTVSLTYFRKNAYSVISVLVTERIDDEN